MSEAKPKQPNKITLQFTQAQMTALVDIMDNISAMIGTGDIDFDNDNKKAIKSLDRMLLKNGYKRKFS